MKMERDGDHLIAYLTGEIDHCSVDRLRGEMEAQLQDLSIKRLTFDFSGVSFMDSSGVGMLIGRYKTMLARNGSVYARSMCSTVKRLFQMAGLHRIIAQEEAEENSEHEK